MLLKKFLSALPLLPIWLQNLRYFAALNELMIYVVGRLDEMKNAWEQKLFFAFFR
jgi:hypothetical protein